MHKRARGESIDEPSDPLGPNAGAMKEASYAQKKEGVKGYMLLLMMV